MLPFQLFRSVCHQFADTLCHCAPHRLRHVITTWCACFAKSPLMIFSPCSNYEHVESRNLIDMQSCYFPACFFSWTNFVRCVKHHICSAVSTGCSVSQAGTLLSSHILHPCLQPLFCSELSVLVLLRDIYNACTFHVQKPFCYSSYTFWKTCWVPRATAQCAKAFKADDSTYAAPFCASHLFKGSQMIRPNLSSCVDVIL